MFLQSVNLSFCLFILFSPVDGNNDAQNGCMPNASHIPMKVEIQASPTANSLTRNLPTVLTILNGDVPHVRPRIPGGFPVRDSTISITPSDGYYSAGGLQSTQKGKYGNRDMKAELKDLEVEMDRITLGDLLEEGEGKPLQELLSNNRKVIFRNSLKTARAFR